MTTLYKIKLLYNDEVFYISNSPFCHMIDNFLDDNINNARQFYKNGIHKAILYTTNHNASYVIIQPNHQPKNTRIYLIDDNGEIDITNKSFRFYNYVCNLRIKSCLMGEYIYDNAYNYDYMIEDDKISHYIKELSNDIMLYENVLFFNNDDDLVKIRIYSDKKPCSTLSQYLK